MKKKKKRLQMLKTNGEIRIACKYKVKNNILGVRGFHN